LNKYDCCSDDEKLAAVVIRTCQEHGVELFLLDTGRAGGDTEKEFLTQEVIETLLYSLQFTLE